MSKKGKNENSEVPPMDVEEEGADKERYELLQRLQNWLETPMIMTTMGSEFWPQMAATPNWRGPNN